MAEAKEQSVERAASNDHDIENGVADDVDHSLDDTAPLPALPALSGLSTSAANDASFSGQAVDESIERLVSLLESIDKRLEDLTQALVSLNAEPTVIGKTAKRPTKAGASKKSAARNSTVKRCAGT